MLSTIFTNGVFWFGFIVGIITIFILAYLYNYFSGKPRRYCIDCYSEEKNFRFMTWVEFPDGSMKLVRCSNEWHNNSNEYDGI